MKKDREKNPKQILLYTNFTFVART